MRPPSSPRAARAAGAARETLPIARSPPECPAPPRSRRAARAATHGRGAVRRRGLHARRDRGGAGHSGGDRAIGSVSRAAPAARAARGLEGGRMKEPLPFDHRPDTLLGEALRQALDPGDVTPFVARVLARAAEVRIASWDTVLARWARAGVAAAVLVALAAGYLVGRASAAPAPRPSVYDALMAPPAHPGEVEIVLASVIGN